MSLPLAREMEFYLFKIDELGQATTLPHDRAGYMDIVPDDKGEHIRREICLMLEQMGIQPESSHHESGPGQNEIDFRYSDPLTAPDNAITFQAVVRMVAAQNGLCSQLYAPSPFPIGRQRHAHQHLCQGGRGKGSAACRYGRNPGKMCGDHTVFKSL